MTSGALRTPAVLSPPADLDAGSLFDRFMATTSCVIRPRAAAARTGSAGARGSP